MGWMCGVKKGKGSEYISAPPSYFSHMQPTLVSLPRSSLDLLTWQRYPSCWAMQVAPCWQGLDSHGFTLSWHILPWNPGGQWQK